MVCCRSPRTMFLMCRYCVYKCRRVLSISLRREVGVLGYYGVVIVWAS